GLVVDGAGGRELVAEGLSEGEISGGADRRVSVAPGAGVGGRTPDLHIRPVGGLPDLPLLSADEDLCRRPERFFRTFPGNRIHPSVQRALRLGCDAEVVSD